MTVISSSRFVVALVDSPSQTGFYSLSDSNTFSFFTAPIGFIGLRHNSTSFGSISKLSSRVISIHFIMASERVLTLCLFLVCCLTIVYCKKIDFKFCISKSDFYQMLMRECGVIVRKSIIDASNPVETSLNARSFLRGRQFKRGESGEPSRPTDYIEECCIEGCRTEEVMEYC
ncbi:uncharacterized protein LOC116300241 isoform X2 [Actinia tenebrosa]|uniref:Uncharacterized protein LOC116300241 isoform X2 n=1 Tax=Actinia tenebrosa TaxID=6105 RepID=A0A6P8IE68_ACTTE|nr:uncharacterized protein LOC116300241 isoform X2 [Actinia tenebrosa]